MSLAARRTPHDILILVRKTVADVYTRSSANSGHQRILLRSVEMQDFVLINLYYRAAKSLYSYRNVIEVYETVIFFILVAAWSLFHTSESILKYSFVVRN